MCLAILPGQRYGMRVTLITMGGICGASLNGDFLRLESCVSHSTGELALR